MSSTLAGDMGRSPNEANGIRRPGQTVAHTWSAGVRPAAFALICSSVLLGVLIPIFHFSVVNGTLRATIETVFVLSGLVSGWFIWVRCSATRQLSDFLLLGAVLTLTLAQCIFFALPAVGNSHSPDWKAAAPLIVHLEVAVLFAAAALVRRGVVVTRRQATLLLATPLVVVAAVAVGALLVSGDAAWFGADAHPDSTTTALAIALTVPAIVLMLVAAVGFGRSVLRQRNIDGAARRGSDSAGRGLVAFVARSWTDSQISFRARVSMRRSIRADPALRVELTQTATACASRRNLPQRSDDGSCAICMTEWLKTSRSSPPTRSALFKISAPSIHSRWRRGAPLRPRGALSPTYPHPTRRRRPQL